MNCVFAYTNDSVPSPSSSYKNILKSLIKGDVLKMGVLLSFFFSVFALYTITVNISSTEGYYYAQAMKSQEKANFQYNITKLNVMTMQSNLRNTVSFEATNKHSRVEEITILK